MILLIFAIMPVLATMTTCRRVEKEFCPDLSGLAVTPCDIFATFKNFLLLERVLNADRNVAVNLSCNDYVQRVEDSALACRPWFESKKA